MRPLIGVTPDTHHQDTCPAPACCIPTRSKEEKMVLLGDRYLQAILDHGGLPVLLPVTDHPALVREMCARLDGLLLPGGAFDVPPEFYGEKPKPWLGRLKPLRSRFERALLQTALKRDLPVLGVCGGMQIINVVFGGTLYQDILKERPSSNNHEQKIKKTRTSHQVQVMPATILTKIISGSRESEGLRIPVNSTHHQAVKDVGKGLIVCGLAPDGIIEALESPRHRFVLGLQFHPEVLYPRHAYAENIFRAFVKEASSQ